MSRVDKIIFFYLKMNTVKAMRILQEALNHLQATKVQNISPESLSRIQTAELTDVIDWQITKSNAPIEERVKDMTACHEFVMTRRQRFAELDDDEYQAQADWIQHDRAVRYINFLNRRGDASMRKQLPVDRYSSKMDKDAVIEAKLMFATFPNLNPKEPVDGATHAAA